MHHVLSPRAQALSDYSVSQYIYRHFSLQQEQKRGSSNWQTCPEPWPSRHTSTDSFEMCDSLFPAEAHEKSYEKQEFNFIKMTVWLFAAEIILVQCM